METVDVDELREQLAQSAMNLEDQKNHFKKTYAKQQKDIEFGYE